MSLARRLRSTITARDRPLCTIKGLLVPWEHTGHMNVTERDDVKRRLSRSERITDRKTAGHTLGSPRRQLRLDMGTKLEHHDVTG